MLTSEIVRIKRLQKMCGTYATARHLAKRGVSLFEAHVILTGYPPRPRTY